MRLQIEKKISMSIRKEILGQEKYKNNNGHAIEAEKIDCITTYHHIADGFYKSACGACGTDMGSRSCGWDIAGQVLECVKCKKMNLVLRSDCDWISEQIEQSLTRANKLERLEAYIKQVDVAEKIALLDKIQNLEKKLEQIQNLTK